MHSRGVQAWLRTGVYKVVDLFEASEHTVMIVLATIVGGLGGLGAVGFRLLINGIQWLTIGQTGTTILGRVAELPWWYLVALPAVGGLFVGPLIHFLAREAKGHGVPEVMEAVALRGGRIRPRLVLVKSLASAATIATGGSVGREGPIVQVGSAIGSAFGQLLRVSPDRMRVLVGCGAAAGIAATFNSPVAGVIFAIELILGNYAITTLTPLIVSSVVATVVCYAFPSVTGGNVRAFDIPFTYELVSAWEIPLFALLGVAAGLVALLFVVAIYAAEDAFDRVPIPPYVKPVAGGLMLGGLLLLAQWLTGYAHGFGVGYQTIEMAMTGHMVWTVLVLVLALKLVMTPLSIGCGLSGGVFAPSLVVGSLTGALFGAAANALFPGMTGPVGAYALVGMAAVVAGATHAPIMAILMLFELSGDYQIILPLMIACVIASLITSRLKKDSIYTQKLTRRGVDLSRGLEATIMETTHVGDVMRREVPTVRLGASFVEVVHQLLEERRHQLYVVDAEGRLAGVITLDDVKPVLLETGLDDAVAAADLMDPEVPRLTPSCSLAASIGTLGAGRYEELPLVEDPPEPGEASSGRLVGAVARRDVFQFYNHEVLRRGTLGLKYVHREPEHARTDWVEMPPDHEVAVVPVTAKMAGKTLSELALRSRYNVNVVAIRSHRSASQSSGDREVPDPQKPLHHADALIVTGIIADIQRMKDDLG
jgi:CIC family chloride channel protein